MHAREVVSLVCKHRGILDIPENCPPIMKDIFLRCWNYEVEKRPRFDNLQLVFEKLTEDYTLLDENSLSKASFSLPAFQDETLILNPSSQENKNAHHSENGKLVTLPKNKLMTIGGIVTLAIICIIAVTSSVTFKSGNKSTPISQKMQIMTSKYGFIFLGN